MKKLLFLLISLSPLMATAQSGSITYERVVKIDIDLPPEMESMRAQIPTENKSSLVLYFNELESLMKAAPKEEKEDLNVVRGNGMAMMFGGRGNDENETYMNLDEGSITEKRDFMGRTFLIGGEQPTYAWKLTGEQSEYMGYAVQRATAVRDSTTIEAWFSPDIPVSAGPEMFTGLPGMILVLSINDGKMQYAAKSINLDGLEDGAIVAPKEGKKVSRAEFDQIMEEKMKEMQAQFGGRGGNAVRIMRHN
ncbi:GLPGLI family protein [bacterium]|nr:GLPGLI family protein [bacterium]